MTPSHTVAKFEPNTNYERNGDLELSDRHRESAIAVTGPLSVEEDTICLFHLTLLEYPMKYPLCFLKLISSAH